MKYSRAFGLLTVAFTSSVLADECSDACTAAHDACSTAPGANQATCAAEYAECLGYNPYDPVFVEPTACASGTATATATETVTATITASATATATGETCEDICVHKYDVCVQTPGADIPTCEEAVGSCKAECAAPVSPCEQKCDDDYDNCASAPGAILSVCTEGRFICKSDCGTTTTTPTPTPTPSPDMCALECTKKHIACSSAPGANQSTCAAEFAECLGYNPYDPVYVAPTACHQPIKTLTTVPVPVKTITPEVCCVQCTIVYTSCCNAPGAIIDTCKSEYTVCLGYNPFDVSPWVEPSACVIVYDNHPYSPSHPDNKPPMPPNGGDHPMPPKGGDHPAPPSPPSPPSPPPPPSPPKGVTPPPPMAAKNGTVTPEQCCVTCKTAYTTCCAAPGAVIETCKTTYCGCLGYNPWDVTPFVEPSKCVVVDKSKPTTPSNGGKVPVIVSGGERMQPALALLALGAAVFFF